MFGSGLRTSVLNAMLAKSPMVRYLDYNVRAVVVTIATRFRLHLPLQRGKRQGVVPS